MHQIIMFIVLISITDKTFLWDVNSLVNNWTEAGPLNIARSEFAMFTYNGVIYAAGGLDNTGSQLTSVEEFDLATLTWSLSSLVLPYGGRAEFAFSCTSNVVHIIVNRQYFIYLDNNLVFKDIIALPDDLSGKFVLYVVIF